MKLEEIKKFVAELLGLSQEELAKKENELKKELFDLRFQAAAGQQIKLPVERSEKTNCTC